MEQCEIYMWWWCEILLISENSFNTYLHALPIFYWMKIFVSMGLPFMKAKKMKLWRCYSLGSHCSRNNNLAADLQLISAPSLPCMWSSRLMMANDTTIVKVTQRGEKNFPTHSHTYNILATTGLQVRKVKMSWVWVLNRQQSL